MSLCLRQGAKRESDRERGNYNWSLSSVHVIALGVTKFHYWERFPLVSCLSDFSIVFAIGLLSAVAGESWKGARVSKKRSMGRLTVVRHVLAHIVVIADYSSAHAV
jgi:hypothetical protein